MEPWQMNPSIRYMDRRTCSLSYKSPVLAYDYRLFAVCDGSCRLLIDGQTLVLNKDSLAIFPPATPYRFLFEESAPAVLYDINFSLGFQPGARHALAPVPQALFDPAKMPEQPDPVLFAQPLLLTGADELRRLTGDILLERERHAPYGGELCSALLKTVLLKALRLSQGGASDLPEPVGAVMRYLEEHCREKIEGRELGRLFGYHPFYLNRLFLLHAGTTMHRYQADCRMKRACSMLTSTRLSVREIADSLGFASPAYFSEAFRRQHGVTPGEFRRSAHASAGSAR